MIIPARFNGPAESGNGGFSAGLIALAGADGHPDSPGEVTLRLPPPLDTPLSIADGQVRAPDGSLVAEVGPAEPIDVAVPPVSYREAERVSTRYPGFTEHPFPTCFVCGPARDDGLRVFPGRLPDGTTAAPWTVPDGVSAAMLWAALDCPGGWTVMSGPQPYVLGRIAVRVSRLPGPGDRCVLRGALAGHDGRKARVHTTLYGPDGTELARSRATWIAVSQLAGQKAL